MKKFMKYCGITAAIVLVLGLVMVTVGGCGGGAKDLTEQVLHGDFSFTGEDVKNWLGEWDDNWVWNEEWETYDLDMDSIFENTYEIIKDQDAYAQDFAANGIMKLDIELGGCEVDIAVSEDGEYHVAAEKISAFQTYVSGDTLYIKGLQSGTWNVNTGMKVTIQIPAETVFEEVEFSFGAGDFHIESLQAKKVELELGAGRVQIEELKAETLQGEAGAGQLLIDNAEFTGDVALSVGVGEAVLKGSIPKNLVAECGMGNVEITVVGSTEMDHNIEMECAAGNLTVGSNTISGLVSEKEIDNGADSNYELSCAMGNLTVTFE